MIHSLEVRSIFSHFVLKKHIWFCADYFCISYGVEICPCRCGIPGIRNVRRSVNGGLVHVCFSVTPGIAVSMREIKIQGCTTFLSKVKRKFVNNSGSN